MKTNSLTRSILGSSFPVVALGLFIALQACTTSRLPKSLPTAKASNNPLTAYNGPSLYIGNVTVNYPQAAASGTPVTGGQTGTVDVAFDTTKSTANVNTLCTAASGSGTTTMPCMCRFVWQEINTTTGANIPIKRSIQTNATIIGNYRLTCAAPDQRVYSNEILDGTTISFTVVPGSGNASSFTTNTYPLAKSTMAQKGTFQDYAGHFFDNVLRYTCYEQFKRGMTLQSKLQAQTNSNTGDVIKFPLASQFCLRKADGSTPGSGGNGACDSLEDIQNSSQAYYYNLYVRDSERGSINPSNDRYICPKVDEYLSTGSGALSNAWPLDSSFALSMDRTADFTVGVEAFTHLSNPSDPSSASGGSCLNNGNTTSTAGQTGNNNSLVKSCLGFATQPNPDGTCPSFMDNTDHIRQTFRLRRFIALYPQVFDTNGSPMNQTQATDTIYVLDREVKVPNSGSSSPTTKPYTMRGPKPCPFAFFDHKAVTGVPAPQVNEYVGDLLPTYAATNNYAWKGTNIDGIEFPNTDTKNSCSAVLPILSSDRTMLSMTTVNASNPVYQHVYVRPIQPWAPHYVEDTKFLACAPKQDGDLRDPPLHFAKDTATGNIGWCAEVYPTQNNNVTSLDYRSKVDVPYGGAVAPFTSHVVKNSVSQICTAKKPSSIPVGTLPSGAKIYPDPSAGSCPNTVGGSVRQGVAWHPTDFVVDTRKTLETNGSITYDPVCSNQTCDRTVSVPSGSNIAWATFPLLATASWVEEAITSDSTYGCIITYDAGNGKAGKASPAGGCCGDSVMLTTGFTNAASPLSAHLEPDAACLTPKY